MSDPRARVLRQNPTDAERKLWADLRLRQVHGHKFRRQRPIGPYIVDFVCLEENPPTPPLQRGVRGDLVDGS
jgi:very-short-patch-repair endonuclease